LLHVFFFLFFFFFSASHAVFGLIEAVESRSWAQLDAMWWVHYRELYNLKPVKCLSVVGVPRRWFLLGAAARPVWPESLMGGLIFSAYEWGKDRLRGM